MKICKRFKTGSLALITCLTIGQSGCSSSFFADNSNLCIGDNGVYQRCSGASGFGNNGANYTGNQRILVHELLPEYVEQLAMRLVDNMQAIDVQGTVAITSIVSFDSNLRQGDLLGNQLSELLYSELQQLDVSLADYNVRDYIEPTSTGVFSLSREYNEYDDLPFEYILTGTWLKAKKGIMVNARIVGLYNKKVIATGSTLIPNFILSDKYHN
jgi:TolB-like protein